MGKSLGSKVLFSAMVIFVSSFSACVSEAEDLDVNPTTASAAPTSTMRTVTNGNAKKSNPPFADPAVPATAAAAVPTLPPPTESNEYDSFAGWPNGGRYKQYITFQSAGAGTSYVGNDALTYGTWDGNWGREYFLGITKQGDSLTSSSTSTSDAIAKTSTQTTTYSGQKNPYIISLGAGVRHKIHQDKWLQVYTGLYGGLTYTSDVSYPVGTQTTSTPNTATPGNNTVGNTDFGASTAKTALNGFVGAKVGSEFYVKWFPGLALGFAGGFFTTVGGTSVTNTSTSTSTYQNVNGVAQTPTTNQTSSGSSRNDPGGSFSTFGVGGTVFQLTGTFTISYVWN